MCKQASVFFFEKEIPHFGSGSNRPQYSRSVTKKIKFDVKVADDDNDDDYYYEGSDGDDVIEVVLMMIMTMQDRYLMIIYLLVCFYV